MSGSAWSNQVQNLIIVAGSGVSGVFVYDPSYAAGNEIASVSDSLVSPTGDSNVKGIAAYVPFGGDRCAVALNQVGPGGVPGLTVQDTASIPTTPAGVYAIAAASGVADAELHSGQATPGDVFATVSVRSSTDSGTQRGQCTITAGLVIVGGLVIVSPTGDTTGAADTATINTALGTGGSVLLTQGTFYLNAPVSWNNAQITGCGDDTTIQPGSGWAGSALLKPGSNTAVMNVAGYGGTNVRANNPAADFIATQTGATWWRAENVRCQYMNGWIINCVPAVASHGTVRNIKSEHCAGGISINAGTGASVTAEINLYDLDIQNCEVNEILFWSAVTDVLCAGPVNGSISGSLAVNGITIQGSCQTCLLRNIDIGGGRGTGLLVIQDAGGSSPTEIEIGPGTVQTGAAGVVVNGGASRLGFSQLWAKRMQGDGWQWNGTGTFNVMQGCGGNTNNQAAGTAYDVNVTSTARLLNDGFRYVSGAVTAGRNLTVAGNHYTEANPPSALTTAGNAPGGW